DASIRGKLGFALDRFQIYGTGGVAFGEVKAAYSCPTCSHAPNAFDTEAGMRVGWTAGGGASVLIDPKWSTNVEYRYTRYNIGGSFSDPVTTATDSGAKLAFNAVTLGISYHFLPRRPPPSRSRSCRRPPRCRCRRRWPRRCRARTWFFSISTATP